MPRWKRRRAIAILGCGPAGIFAAHALALLGKNPFTIYSNKRVSEMFGAQYLHESIPGLSRAPFMVDYQLRGTLEGYARKVYDGQVPESELSPANLLGRHKAWDIREAYHEGYRLYESAIEHEPGMDAKTISKIVEAYEGRVISTIPLPTLCMDRVAHAFSSTTVWAIGDAPERGVFCPVSVPSLLDTVVCNGETEPAWYRYSNIKGYRTAEWPGKSRPPFDGVSSVIKPVSNTCNCHPTVLRLGRYGSWTKGVLSHDAYYTTARALS